MRRSRATVAHIQRPVLAGGNVGWAHKSNGPAEAATSPSQILNLSRKENAVDARSDIIKGAWLEGPTPLVARTAAQIAVWRESGDFVPVLWNGGLLGAAPHVMDRVRVPDPISAEDYIVGMEFLGFRFYAAEHEGRSWFLVGLPEEPIPPPWHAYSLRLETAFDRAKRKAEAIEFLKRRAA